MANKGISYKLLTVWGPISIEIHVNGVYIVSVYVHAVHCAVQMIRCLIVFNKTQNKVTFKRSVL